MWSVWVLTLASRCEEVSRSKFWHVLSTQELEDCGAAGSSLERAEALEVEGAALQALEKDRTGSINTHYYQLKTLSLSANSMTLPSRLCLRC